MRLVQALLALLFIALMFGESEEIGMKNMGPYTIEVNQVYLCEDQGTGKGKFNISLYLGKEPGPKFKKHLHRGGFSFPFTADDVTRMEIEGKIYQKKTNDFLLMYNYKGDLCDTLKNIASTAFKSLRKEIGLPEKDVCNVPMGNYTFNDWEVPFSLPTPMLEYGTYKYTVTFLADKQVYGCFVVMILIKRKY